MSENDDTIPTPPQPLTYEPLGYLTNHQAPGDSDESRPVETYANQLITNIIKDASQTASKNPDETLDNTTELNFPPKSTPNPSENTTTNLDQSEYSISNGGPDGNDFNHEDIQKKMNDVIQDIQSRSTNDINTSRKSIASNHLNDDQTNSTENPVRSTNEPTVVDHSISNVQSSPSPIRQDESSSDVDDILGIKAQPNNTNVSMDDFTDQNRSDQGSHVANRLDENDDFFNTKVATMKDDQRPKSVIKQNNLDETTNFGTTSPPRAPSVSSKRSVRAAPDEPSTSGDEKRVDMSPTKLPDDTGNDTDLDNREVANIARRPSRALSPLNRPRSPTPNDSRKMSTSNELPPTLPVEQSSSPTKLMHDDQSPTLADDNQGKENLEPSRRESGSKNDDQQAFRPGNADQTKSDDGPLESSFRRPSTTGTKYFQVTDEQSKLIATGEQLQIPTDDYHNQRINSPSPLPTDVKSLVLVNPLLDSTPTENEQNRSRPPSETNRKNSTTSLTSNEKVINGDVLPSTSRRESNLSQPPINDTTDQKLPSRRESQLIEQAPQISTSRRASISQQQQDELQSNVLQEPTSHQESSYPELPTSSPRESTTIEQKPPSRKESTASEQQVSSKRVSIQQQPQATHRRESAIDEPKTASRRGSVGSEQPPSSKRASTVIEQQPQPPSQRESVTNEQETTSRKSSTTSEQQISNQRESPIPTEPKPSSRRESTHEEQQIPSRTGSTNFEDQSPSRRASTAIQPKPSSRRDSVADEQKSISHRGSTNDVLQVPNERETIVSEQGTSSRRVSTNDEQKPSSRKGSTTYEQEVSSKRPSVAPQQPTSSRKGSTASEQEVPSKRPSVAPQQTTSSRKASTSSEQEVPSKRLSVAPQQLSSSRRESAVDEGKPTSRKGSTAAEQQPSSRRESTYDKQKVGSRKASTAAEQPLLIRTESPVPEQEASSRRESHAADQHSTHRRQSSFDHQEQKSSSKPVSRKTSVAEQHQEDQDASRRESQQQAPSSRRTSTNRDNQSTSPHRSSNIHASSSQESSHRHSLSKLEQLPITAVANKDSRRLSVNVHDTNHQQIRHESHSTYKETPPSDADDVSQRKSKTHKQERKSSPDKRQKSSSTADENSHRRSSFHRHTGQETKRNSTLRTDETVVTPIAIESSKARYLNGKRSSMTDSSNEQTPTSKLPPVNSSHQPERQHRSEPLNKQKPPVSNRAGIKPVSSSRATTATEDEQTSHWTKKIPVPSIHLTDDEILSAREDQPRPQSPNVEQLAERNPVPALPLTTSTGKRRSTGEKTDLQKRREQHRGSRRSTSADSATPIRLVDDDSLDSTSENPAEFDRHKRRHIKPKKKDVETNTDHFLNSQYFQHGSFDDQESSPHRPLKATKPMSDHLHAARRRAPNKEQILTTPDTVRDTETPIVRRTVKQSKDSHQDKDPVHVNVTVVVKKFASPSKDETPLATAEAFIEQKPRQQYFEPAPRPPEKSPLTTETKDEINERRKSTEQEQRIPSSEQKHLEHHDRHTQSDTEQIITDTQKKRRRPKRISRTSQTYECVFRRMDRDQQQDLRTTSDTEKNIQTRKSQLRPRKKSPKKNFPVYLSTDSFKLEELLPKQYHQSRRNISKSSSNARSVSPQGGKLLILRPTLPFHHTDAVNVQRVCLQYAIDLIPNDHPSSATISTHRNKATVLRQPEQMNNLPMISSSSPGGHMSTSNKSNSKEKSASYKSENDTHQPRKNGGAV